MMPGSSYPRFCPVAMTASLLEPRWTMLLLCEMWSGSTRFNEIQRGVLGMSPGLTGGIWGEGTWTNGEGGPVAEASGTRTPWPRPASTRPRTASRRSLRFRIAGRAPSPATSGRRATTPTSSCRSGPSGRQRALRPVRPQRSRGRRRLGRGLWLGRVVHRQHGRLPRHERGLRQRDERARPHAVGGHEPDGRVRTSGADGCLPAAPLHSKAWFLPSASFAEVSRNGRKSVTSGP
jgi:hypothetical protein